MAISDTYEHTTHGDESVNLPIREQMKVRLIEINRELNMMREHSSNFDVVKHLGSAIMEVQGAFIALQKLK